MDITAVLEALDGLMLVEDVQAAVAACTAAAGMVCERLLPGADENDPRAIDAAAGEAFYRLAFGAGAQTDDISSFRAGDITVTRAVRGPFESAQKVRDMMFARASGVLADPGDFLFRGVGG